MRVCAIAMIRAAAFMLLFVGCDAGAKPDASPPATPTAPPIEEASAASGQSLFAAEEGFTLLGLKDFEAFSKEPGGESIWTDDGTVIRCTGKPRGYLYSKKSFRNFTLRLDYRFLPAAGKQDPKRLAASNTGVLVYISCEHKVWPRSLEVQGKHVEVGSIRPNGGAATVEIEDDSAAREAARKPVGEWNSLEIVSRDGALVSHLNGQQICSSRPGDLREGSIGLQAEDFPVEFRNLRLREE